MSSEDIKILAEIINGILNPDNILRNQAVKKLDDLRQNTPALIICLFKIIQEIPNHQTKLISSVLLTNILKIKEHELSNENWDKIPKEDREIIRKISIEILKAEKDKKLKIKYCNLIHNIYDNSYESSEPFQGVVDYIYENIPLDLTDDNLVHIETALELLADNFTYLDGEFMKIIDGFLHNFRYFFKTNSVSLKTKTVKTIAEIINYCDEDKVTVFAEFIMNILETTLRALENSGKYENELKECLKSLNEISSSEPTLLIKHFNDLYILMTKVIEKKDYLDEKIRELAFDIITNTIERSPKLFSKDPEKLSHFFEMLFKFSLEMDEDIPDDWLTPTISTYQEDDTQEEKIKTVFSFITRLNECLTSKLILSEMQKIISKMLEIQNDFRYKYISLLSILEISNLLDDISLIDSIFPKIYQETSNQNPKVRFAGISCIKAFSLCFSYNYKKNHHESFVNLLLNNLQTEKVLRVQIEIINALLEFVNECPTKILLLYLERILEVFIQLFLRVDINISNLLRKKILKLITKIISNSKENILQYSEKILKILLELFNNFYTNKINTELYGDFLECIVLIGPYSKDLYFSTLPALVKIILEIQNNIPISSDPTRNSLENVYGELIPILKNNFKSLLPEVIKSILLLVKNLPQMSVSSVPSENFSIEAILSEKTEENKHNIIKSIQTSSTEDITSAIKLLKKAIKNLGEDYLPYIEVTQTELFPLINYRINDEIRIQSVKIFHHLVEIISKFSTKENLILITKNYLTQIIESIEKEYDNTALLIKIKHLGKIVLKSNYFLTKDELNSFFAKLTCLIDEIEARRIQLLKHHEKYLLKNSRKSITPQVEEEDGEFQEVDQNDPEKILTEDIEEIEEIQGYISDVIGFSFKTHKDISTDIVNIILNNWLPKYFRSDASIFEIKMGILILDDMIEYLGQDFLRDLWNQMSKILIQYTTHGDCKIRRAACYGIGILAQNTTENFSAFSDDAINSLAFALQIQIESRNEDEWGAAKDNATTALGKIIKYQYNSVNMENCFYLWLRNLPIIYDTTESVEQHGILCDFILNKPEFCYGGNLVNMEYIVRILAKIYATEKFSDEELDVKIKIITSSWKEKENIMGFVENIKNSSEPMIKKKINKIMM